MLGAELALDKEVSASSFEAVRRQKALMYVYLSSSTWLTTCKFSERADSPMPISSGEEV